MANPQPIGDEFAGRVDEIEQLVAGGSVQPAMRRLHDLAADFGTREQQHEVVVLNARLSQLRRDLRQYGITETAGAERTKINQAVLSLADDIVEDCRTRREAARPPAPVLVQSVPVVPVELPRVASAEPAKPIEIAESPEPAVSAVGPRLAPVTPQPNLKAFPTAATIPAPVHRFESTRGGSPEPSPLVFKCENLGKRYSTFSLSGVNLELRAGEICGLIGINGSGKTTLLQVIAGELKHSTGKLSYPALDTGRNWRRIRNQVAYVQQSPPRWPGKLADNLAFVSAEHGLKGAENRAEVERVLYRLTLDDYARHSWNEISGGYKMRFELARALLSKPRLLVLDEPLSPLDVLTQQLFLEDLRNLANSRNHPLAVVLSSQNLHEVEGIADKILFLDGGNAVFCGPTDDLADRFDDHLFELQTRAASAAVERALERLCDPAVDFFGQSMHVRVPVTVSCAQVLHALLDANIDIKHFRDISRSTRRLFESRGVEL